ncbi:hypothetical protein O181_092043 [Austropuccinia psidii MF-1]|uniref:Uncharacterized protein n=1 Tax=Austropuccinia psidii MF-1 TaxID=1389203 RepID=A0A9Q3IYH9_9BASI|nr:hypothetical protein [Austropuccinia psidii MF-1]
MNEVVEKQDHSYEKEIKESESSEGDEFNIVIAKINNIALIYQVLDSKSNLPQVRKSDTCLKNIQDAKLPRIKLARGMGYIAGKASIRISMIKNQEERISLNTDA